MLDGSDMLALRIQTERKTRAEPRPRQIQQAADEAADELYRLLEQRTQDFLNEQERVRELEAVQMDTLAFFYARDPVAVATLCDETLDPSGALLGRVREAHEGGASLADCNRRNRPEGS